MKVHPAGLLALEKPPGIRAHPNRAGIDRRALLLAPYDVKAECYRWEAGEDGEKTRPGGGVAGAGVFFLLNRLDAPTSGLLLGTACPEIAAEVRRRFAAHEVGKRYFAVVKGRAARLRETWRDRLVTGRQGGRLRSRPRANGENPGRRGGGGGGGAAGDLAVTAVRGEREGRGAGSGGAPPCSLIRLEPVTGRTHQLRVQCALRHFPILGDATYGDFAFNRAVQRATGCKRLFLHAGGISLTFRHRGREEQFSAESSLPPEFAVVLGAPSGG